MRKASFFDLRRLKVACVELGPKLVAISVNTYLVSDKMSDQ